MPSLERLFDFETGCFAIKGAPPENQIGREPSGGWVSHFCPMNDSEQRWVGKIRNDGSRLILYQVKLPTLFVLVRYDTATGIANGRIISPSAAKKQQVSLSRVNHRRATKTRRPRPLTARQAEVIQIVGECKGNIAQAAEKLGRNRKTVDETFRSGMAKLGKQAIRSKDKTRLFARDRRGQEDISEDDDYRRGQKDISEDDDCRY